MAARRGQLSSKIPRDQALSGMRSWCPGWDPGTCRGRDSVGPPALPPPPPAREPRAPSGTSCRDHLRAGAGPAPRVSSPWSGQRPLGGDASFAWCSGHVLLVAGPVWDALCNQGWAFLQNPSGSSRRLAIY